MSSGIYVWLDLANWRFCGDVGGCGMPMTAGSPLVLFFVECCIHLHDELARISDGREVRVRHWMNDRGGMVPLLLLVII